MSKFLEEKHQLPNIELKRVHRVGRRRDNHHRPIVAGFSRFSDREAVLRNAAKLRGTKIYINEIFFPASKEIRKAKLLLLKQARSQARIAYFSHRKLIIEVRSETSNRSVKMMT